MMPEKNKFVCRYSFFFLVLCYHQPNELLLICMHICLFKFFYLNLYISIAFIIRDILHVKGARIIIVQQEITHIQATDYTCI